MKSILMVIVLLLSTAVYSLSAEMSCADYDCACKACVPFTDICHEETAEAVFFFCTDIINFMIEGQQYEFVVRNKDLNGCDMWLVGKSDGYDFTVKGKSCGLSVECICEDFN